MSASKRSGSTSVKSELRSKGYAANAVHVAVRTPKLSRADRAMLLRAKILTAAAEVIGEFGYQNASVSRIASASSVAQGTLYLYFETRQSLFDAVLPHVGQDMMHFIGERLRGATDFVDVEKRGIRAFFEYLRLNPGFYRVLNEAEFAAPKGHRLHFELLVDHYVLSMKRSIEEGVFRPFKDEELRVVAYTMMACRSYLYLGYVKYGGMAIPPDYVIEIYSNLISSSCEPVQITMAKRGGFGSTTALSTG